MINIADFKAAKRLPANIPFYPSKQGSGRFVGSAFGITLVTITGYDPKLPTFVVDDPGKEGEIPNPNLFYLTNKVAIEPAFKM